MIEYGIIINHQLIIHRTEHSGDKPIIYTDIPTKDFVCTYAWEERTDGIYQVWTVTDIPVEPIEDDELSAEEALEIITGGYAE